MWKGFFVLLILGAAGYFGYRAWKAPAPPPPVPAGASAPPATPRPPGGPLPGGGRPEGQAPAPAPPAAAGGGRALYQQGQYAQAAPALIEEAGRAPGAEAAELLDLAADCQARLGKPADAAAIWTRLLRDFPAHAAAARAGLRLGNALEAQGDLEGARAQFAATWRHPAADRAALAQRMIDLNRQLLFSRRPTRDSVIHVVQPGENLTTIGKKYGIEAGGLLRINGLKNTGIFPNDKLKVPKGRFRIEVSKSRRRLLLFYDDAAARMYDVAIGREGHETPSGEFVIAKKDPTPSWTQTTDDGRRVVIPYGQPGHMLGSRWLGFAEPHQDLGIHGTPPSEEGKIGGAVSKGCIRMRNAEVEEVYDLVPKNTKVAITD